MAGRRERCDRCRWWETGKLREGYGYCHGSTPTRNHQGMGEWPVTGDEDYCGQFTPTQRVESHAEHAVASRTLADPPLPHR